MVLGSLGAFLVLEARDHAQARNAKPLARLSQVMSERSSRPAGAVGAALARMWQGLAPRRADGRLAVLSGATGAEPATGEARARRRGPDAPACRTCRCGRRGAFSATAWSRNSP